jgi:surface antigen
MSFMDHRRRGTDEGQVGARPEHMSSLNAQQVPGNQRPFPENSPVSVGSLQGQSNQSYSVPPDGTSQPLTAPNTAPVTTNALIDPATLANVSRQLEEVDTGAIATVPKNTSSLREPVVIGRTWSKRTESIRPPRGRRLVVHIAVTSLLLVIMMGTLLAVLPTGSGAHGLLSLFKPESGTVNTKSNNTALVESQAATATAVTQDGFDPGVNTGQYAGIPAAPSGFDNTSNHFYYGQCTSWAAMRYHALTGVWIPWYGNANQWVSGAAANGWVVSNTPKLHSIIVLQAYIQQAGPYGHVAIVEQINPDGSVVTSNWNWAGNWAITSNVTFRPGYGVNFVYMQGS